MLEGDAAVGAAFMLIYLRDLITASDRREYDQAGLLVLLEIISRDAQLFPNGVAQTMWQAEDDE